MGTSVLVVRAWGLGMRLMAFSLFALLACCVERVD